MPTLLALIPLIVQYGVPAAEQLYKMFVTNGTPTQADWDTLKQLTQTTARQQMTAVLASHGIDPNSPQGQSFLNLTPA